MKLKSILIAAMAASVALVACNKAENGADVTVDTTPKSVTINFPNIQTKAVGDAVANGSKVALERFKVFFLDAAGNEVNVPEYPAGTTQKVYFSNQTGEQLPISCTYHFLPSAAVTVAVVGNVGDENTTYADAKDMTALDVPNDVAPGNLATYPLYDDKPLVKSGNGHEPDHSNVYTATLSLTPRVARFEVYGFEYKAATPPATNDYASLSLQNIALNNYYTKYNFITADPAGTKVTETISNSNAWDWVGTQVAVKTSWADSFAPNLVLSPGDKCFVDGTAITDPAEDGEETTGIFTYGLTKTTAPAENPSLVVTLLGQKDGAAAPDTPLYLHAKFTKKMVDGVPADLTIEPGKIYRVLFTFSDANLKQPERCVDLSVDVAEWEVVAVTPEF